ncbi:hypothetical protein B0H66DRAFT_598741 [Apodospora peruviana]|uniref:Uncharacterized protein n=1 Tax=Apodospora peruviana TaxID=516989 RepID=A0AAE0IUL5_9PEZI|nr:hypothetical protein B0H66DRAFT_598741 [Apodospora peruviana]
MSTPEKNMAMSLKQAFVTKKWTPHVRPEAVPSASSSSSSSSGTAATNKVLLDHLLHDISLDEADELRKKIALHAMKGWRANMEQVFSMLPSTSLGEQLLDDIDEFNAEFLRLTRRKFCPKREQRLWEAAFLDSLTALVHGSETIEWAAGNHDISVTRNICREVFINGRSQRALLEDGVNRYNPYRDESKIVGFDFGKKCFRQTVNHACALRYMIDWIVVQGKPWTEELVQNTHVILQDWVTANFSVDKTQEAIADLRKWCNLHLERLPPRRMAELLFFLEHSQNSSSSESTSYRNAIKGVIFRAALAHSLVIHVWAFREHGNGRMVRMIVNTLMLKHGGCVAPLGCEQEEKEAYLDIVHDTATSWCKSFGYVDFPFPSWCAFKRSVGERVFLPDMEVQQQPAPEPDLKSDGKGKQPGGR